MSDYVQLKNLQGQPLKPVTDLAAINMTTTNGIQVVPANGGTIGITSGYIDSAYYVDMVSEDVGPASTSSAYIEGGTATLITGAYTVTSAVNSSTPSQQKIPSEAAVVSALNNVVTSGTSYFAGTGIAIDAGHTVSVANAPTSAIAGLDTQLTNINATVAAKQDAITAGYRMSLDGTTLNQQRYFPIQDTGTSATITLAAGSAYKIAATTGSKTLAAETIPDGQFGLEGHAEIFIAGAGLIKTTSNVILSQPLEPDSVNNCTIRFHDGRAIISVEDHIAGHVVRSSGSGTDSLKYWLEAANTSDQATQYISVDAELDNTILDFANATVNGEKHLVGNGYDATSVSGLINCGTSKFTVANLALQDVVVNGGTMTLGDAYIPSGSTVSVSGGGLAVEKVTGAGSDSVIDLGGTSIPVPLSGTINARGIAFRNGVTAISVGREASGLFTSCTFSGNTGSATADGTQGGAVKLAPNDSFLFSGCTFSDTTQIGADLYLNGYNTNQYVVAELKDCELLTPTSRSIYGYQESEVRFGGTCKFLGTYSNNSSKGKCTISSGAILDLTGNTNATPIAPGGGITFEQGGATVLYSSGAVSGSYMMDNVTLPAGAKLTNTAVVDLGNTTNGRCTGSASGITIASGYLNVESGGTATATYILPGARLYVAHNGVTSGSIVSSAGRLYANASGVDHGIIILSKGVVYINSGGTASDPIVSSGGSLVVASGGTALLVTSNTGANVTVQDGGYITYKE